MAHDPKKANPTLIIPEAPAKITRKKKKPKEIAVVIPDNCTGCEACVSFCPVDCIEHVQRDTSDGVNVVIPKRGRGEVSVTFRAPEPGRYVFECTRMCGAGHHFMRGELLVRNPSATQSRK